MVICLWVLMPFSLFVLFCCSKICLSYDCRVIFHLIKVVCIESGLFRLRFPINVNHHLTVMLAETRPFVNFSFFFFFFFNRSGEGWWQFLSFGCLMTSLLL